MKITLKLLVFCYVLDAFMFTFYSFTLGPEPDPVINGKDVAYYTQTLNTVKVKVIRQEFIYNLCHLRERAHE